MPTRLEQAIKLAEGWRLEAESYKARFEEVREKARALEAAANGDVWYWQGDGYDFPESLTCKVVMSASTLRSLLDKAENAYGHFGPPRHGV